MFCRPGVLAQCRPSGVKSRMPDSAVLQSHICGPQVSRHHEPSTTDPQEMECFRGKIIPARMLYNTALLKDKRVLVLGGGKTSCVWPFVCTPGQLQCCTV